MVVVLKRTNETQFSVDKLPGRDPLPSERLERQILSSTQICAFMLERPSSRLSDCYCIVLPLRTRNEKNQLQTVEQRSSASRSPPQQINLCTSRYESVYLAPTRREIQQFLPRDRMTRGSGIERNRVRESRTKPENCSKNRIQ